MAISIDRHEADQSGSSTPGLTPLDDIHKGRLANHEPDSETGRLPAQERERDRKTPKRSKATRKKEK